MCFFIHQFGLEPWQIFYSTDLILHVKRILQYKLFNCCLSSSCCFSPSGNSIIYIISSDSSLKFFILSLMIASLYIFALLFEILIVLDLVDHLVRFLYWPSYFSVQLIYCLLWWWFLLCFSFVIVLAVKLFNIKYSEYYFIISNFHLFPPAVLTCCKWSWFFCLIIFSPAAGKC